jgi:hypothetical protein
VVAFVPSTSAPLPCARNMPPGRNPGPLRGVEASIARLLPTQNMHAPAVVLGVIVSG